KECSSNLDRIIINYWKDDGDDQPRNFRPSPKRQVESSCKASSTRFMETQQFPIAPCTIWMLGEAAPVSKAHPRVWLRDPNHLLRVSDGLLRSFMNNCETDI